MLCDGEIEKFNIGKHKVTQKNNYPNFIYRKKTFKLTISIQE